MNVKKFAFVLSLPLTVFIWILLFAYTQQGCEENGEIDVEKAKKDVEVKGGF